MSPFERLPAEIQREVVILVACDEKTWRSTGLIYLSKALVEFERQRALYNLAAMRCFLDLVEAADAVWQPGFYV